ncbi:hypothetical protein GCM10022627_40180 [Haloarcula argentinensis]
MVCGPHQRTPRPRIGKRETLQRLAKGDLTEDELDQQTVYRYARAAYLDRGGTIEDFDAMPWPAVLDWLAIHDILDVRGTLGGLGGD